VADTEGESLTGDIGGDAAEAELHLVGERADGGGADDGGLAGLLHRGAVQRLEVVGGGGEDDDQVAGGRHPARQRAAHGLASGGLGVVGGAVAEPAQARVFEGLDLCVHEVPVGSVARTAHLSVPTRPRRVFGSRTPLAPET
jgi:hypothetical protein